MCVMWSMGRMFRVCYINFLGEPFMAHLNILRKPFGSPYHFYLFNGNPKAKITIL